MARQVPDEGAAGRVQRVLLRVVVAVVRMVMWWQRWWLLLLVVVMEVRRLRVRVDESRVRRRLRRAGMHQVLHIVHGRPSALGEAPAAGRGGGERPGALALSLSLFLSLGSVGRVAYSFSLFPSSRSLA